MSSRMRPQPSTSSLTPSAQSGAPSSESANATALAGVFRTLVFGGAVPIQLVIADNELPPTADRSVEAYYIQAPRISYLPLLLPQIRKYFLDLVLDDNSAASLRDEDIWFEAEGGGPLKWHWPIGLLYDYHLAAHQTSLLPPLPTTSDSSTTDHSILPSSLAAVFAPLTTSSPSSSLMGGSPKLSFPGSLPSSSSPVPTSILTTDSQFTLRPFQRPRTPSSIRSGGSSFNASPAPAVGEAVQPWRVVVHLRDPPMGELVVGNRVEDARMGFMAMVKEADYVRSGSTKRVTNLRKEQQDALWEGVVQNNFDRFWLVGSRLIPLPSLASSSFSPNASRSPTPSGADGNRLPDANGIRNVPVRVFLPEGAPVVQELVAPVQADGSPTTLSRFLATVIPILFPPSTSSPPLAHPLIQGIFPPASTELGWLGACLCGADGWVNIVVVLDERLEGAGGGHERERSGSSRS
ncbi:hypothetical protein JCM11251_003357 [Rhodosporidiobolus azoricus]